MIRDEKTANIMANIFVGKEKPELVEIKKLFEDILNANEICRAFEQKKLSCILKELCIEYIYMYRTSVKDFVKQLFKLPELIMPKVIIKFIQLYVSPKIKHDKLIKRFELEKKDFLKMIKL